MSRAAFVLLLALPLALSGCEETGAAGAGPGSRGRGGPAGAEPLVAVGVAAAVADTVEEVLEGHAPLEPQVHVDVPGRTEGLVIEVLVEEGERVSQGQVLLRMDETRARLRVRETELALEQARTALARAETLTQRGLAPQEELDQAKQAVEQAQLTLEAARLDQADLTLQSPIDGVVTARLVDRGARLQAGALAFRVADPDPLLARVRLPEARADAAAPGQPAWVSIEGGSEPLRGRVIRVAPLVELESGTVGATVAVHDAAAAVRLNRFATVRIVVAVRPDAVTIPQAALALRGDEERVLVCEPLAQGEGVVRHRAIRTGVRQGQRVEVIEGLEAGELVVTAAPDDIRDGTRVRIVARDAAPEADTAPVDTASR